MDELLAERDDLLRENQSLRQENQELGELLKEYEKGLECTTELIRNRAVLFSRYFIFLICSVSRIYTHHPDSSRLQ